MLRTNHLQSDILQSFNVCKTAFSSFQLGFCLGVLFLQCDIMQSSELLKQLSLGGTG